MTYLGRQRSSACRCPFLEPHSAISGIGVAMIVLTVNGYPRESLWETLRTWSLSSGTGERTESSAGYERAASKNPMRLKLMTQ